MKSSIPSTFLNHIVLQAFTEKSTTGFPRKFRCVTSESSINCAIGEEFLVLKFNHIIEWSSGKPCKDEDFWMIEIRQEINICRQMASLDKQQSIMHKTQYVIYVQMICNEITDTLTENVSFV